VRNATRKETTVPLQVTAIMLGVQDQSSEEVDEVVGKAVAAGGVVREAAASQWGGYVGYFSDPDGHLWKVATPG
jgi:uncharacterized glyoxalase superfamily protein PhnB